MTPQLIDFHTADEWRAEEKAYVLRTWTAQSQWNAPTVTGGFGAFALGPPASRHHRSDQDGALDDGTAKGHYVPNRLVNIVVK